MQSVAQPPLHAQSWSDRRSAEALPGHALDALPAEMAAYACAHPVHAPLSAQVHSESTHVPPLHCEVEEQKPPWTQPPAVAQEHAPLVHAPVPHSAESVHVLPARHDELPPSVHEHALEMHAPWAPQSESAWHVSPSLHGAAAAGVVDDLHAPCTATGSANESATRTNGRRGLCCVDIAGLLRRTGDGGSPAEAIREGGRLAQPRPTAAPEREGLG